MRSYTKGSTSVSYTYDADGLRGSKTIVNGDESKYHYVGGQLRYETRGAQKFYYFYDASGNLSAIRYYDASGNMYAFFALTNAQGDVVALYNNDGTCVVTYEYDAWGNCTILSDTTGIGFANLNPIRYRGYYYDTETGLYYLQSRYYDPQVGRFLNADSQLNQKSGPLGFNMFAYCENNPVNSSDITGHWSKRSENIALVAGCIAVVGSVIATVAALVAAPTLLPLTIGLLSVSVASMEDGLASAKSGNSFSNAYTGAVISNSIEQVVSHFSKGNPVAVSVANGGGTALGTAATTHLNNMDPYSQNTPANEIGGKMIKNGVLASVTSFSTGCVNMGVDMANAGQCYMENYTSTFGFGLKVFFSILDDTINIICGE